MGIAKGAGPGQLYMSVFLPSYTNKASDYVVAKEEHGMMIMLDSFLIKTVLLRPQTLNEF